MRVLILVSLLALVGCRDEEVSAPAPSPAGEGEQAPTAVAAAPAEEPEDPLAGAEEPADGEFLRRVRPMVEQICRCQDLACASKLMDDLREYEPTEPELDEAHELSLRMQTCVKRLRPSRSDTPSFDGDDETAPAPAPAVEPTGDAVVEEPEATGEAEPTAPPATYSERMKAAVDAVCACQDLACAVEASRRTGHLEPTPAEMPVAVAQGKRLQECMRRLAEQAQ